MNFTDSFQDFSSGLGLKDVLLYAGIGMVIWYLFKDNLPNVVPSGIYETINKLTRNSLRSNSDKASQSDVIDKVLKGVKIPNNQQQQLFFDLVVSWKHTRDLAEQSGCQKAIEVADQMFPYLSPTVCSQKKSDNNNKNNNNNNNYAKD